jgi:hypothetical protein
VTRAQPIPRAEIEPAAAAGAELARVAEASPPFLTLGDGTRVPARLAVRGYVPRPGETVLVLRTGDGTCWIVGVVSDTPLLDSALSEPAAAPSKVHDRDGRLLFEYDPDSHRAVLHVPDGDLVLRAPAGRLDLEARDGVSIHSAEPVTVTSARRVRVEAAEGAQSASVDVEPGEVAVLTNVLRAAVRRAETVATEALLRARTLEVRTVRSKIVAEVIDTRAGRIVERAKDTYREVERLAQVRAGRIRMAAEKAAQIVGDQLLLKARQTAKIKGERIHLA